MNFSCDCVYCRTKGYVWKVHRNKVWIEIPKNGSAVLKQKHFKSRYPLKDSKILGQSKGIVVVRDPIDRFKSMLSHYFIDGTRVNTGKYWLKKRLGITIFDGEDIADIILSNFNQLSSIEEPHHFFTQSSFIPKEFYFLPETEFVNLDNLSERFRVPKHNVSSSSSIVLSDSHAEHLKVLYEPDFELFDRVS